MQEIMTLATHEVTTGEQSDAFDTTVNALLADGWAILTAGITTTTGPVHTFASMVLVRETQPAPVETGRKYKIGDTVWHNTSTRAYEGKVIAIEGNLYRVKLEEAPPGFSEVMLFADAALSDIPF